MHPGAPLQSQRRGEGKSPGAPYPAGTGPWGSQLAEGSPGRASRHRGTAGRSQIVHIPPLISRLPTLLLSAPRRNWGLFSPLPSPALLKELLHQSQRKQRMGRRPVWGSKATWANMPLLKNNILPPADKIAKSEQSPPPRPYSQGRRVMQRCVCTLGKAINNKAQSSSPRPPPARKTPGRRAIASQRDARICAYQIPYVGKTERKMISSCRQRYRELSAIPLASLHQGLCLPSQLPPCQMQT